MDGGWVEDKDTSSERMVHEKSVFIESYPDEEEELFEWCEDIATKYNQDAFLFKSEKRPFGVYRKDGVLDFYFEGEQLHASGENIIFTNRPETNIKFNRINFKDIEEMYSALRFGNHAGIKFVFESINTRNASGVIDAYSRKNWLEN